MSKDYQAIVIGAIRRLSVRHSTRAFGVKTLSSRKNTGRCLPQRWLYPRKR